MKVIKLAFGNGPDAPTPPPANSSYAIGPVTLRNITIKGAGSYGLEFYNVLGTGNFSSITVTGAALGGLSNPNNKYTIIRGAGNSGW
ncbi:hypothetical protein F0U61_02535 [Archangium violaceum]|uniref:hypothetical protein n=1 Tax=Archangium violaceum TaxID=83451 RepID=UPI002B302860|nr:hypothetical protein F0U61_02535 [Archangium violaceum]